LLQEESPYRTSKTNSFTTLLDIDIVQLSEWTVSKQFPCLANNVLKTSIDHDTAPCHRVALVMPFTMPETNALQPALSSKLAKSKPPEFSACQLCQH
jgi:hypothetical protein